MMYVPSPPHGPISPLHPSSLLLVPFSPCLQGYRWRRRACARALAARVSLLRERLAQGAVGSAWQTWCTHLAQQLAHRRRLQGGCALALVLRAQLEAAPVAWAVAGWALGARRGAQRLHRRRSLRHVAARMHAVAALLAQGAKGAKLQVWRARCQMSRLGLAALGMGLVSSQRRRMMGCAGGAVRRWARKMCVAEAARARRAVQGRAQQCGMLTMRRLMAAADSTSMERAMGAWKVAERERGP